MYEFKRLPLLLRFTQHHIQILPGIEMAGARADLVGWVEDRKEREMCLETLLYR